MTFGMFDTTIKGLTDFVTMWEYVEFDFRLQERAFAGIVGNGILMGI